MKISQIGIELIKKWESFQPIAYLCPAGIWTIGYGHTKNVKQFDTINENEASHLLKNEVIEYEKIVNKNLKVNVNQNQYDALVSHTYNTGGSHNLFRLINEKAEKERIYNWFTMHYISANGTILKGLKLRRIDEAELFFKL